MARKKRTAKKQETQIQDYRHDNAKRKNNPPAGIAARGKINEPPKVEYAYNPHRPPTLRFDGNGDADQIPELLQKAKDKVLSEEEIAVLAEALQHHEPWLEWSGKQETQSFAVDPVALHIHERVSAKAIMNIAARENVQRNLFADPQLAYNEAVQFYQHDVEWANRLILGDSLTVMSSLAQREDLGGKVQTIYFDPPYGIKFASNFQPNVFQRNVTDRTQDLTREPEQIQAYRDTWHLGVHSYLAYLRDRLMVAKELLTDSGSIFVQISEENVHRVRCLLDEVFGCENFVSTITWVRAGMTSSTSLAAVSDYLLWYAKDKTQMKYNQLWAQWDERKPDQLLKSYTQVELADGSRRSMTREERENPGLLPKGSRRFLEVLASSQSGSGATYKYEFEGRVFIPIGKSRGWPTTREGLDRLAKQRRLVGKGRTLYYIRYATDAPGRAMTNLWTDTSGSSPEKKYVVETNPKVIQRCLLMTTDPGDLVLDPTCGGGTTAYVAEQWGRRWITIDTSRVAIALTRQRLLTSMFNWYTLKDLSRGIVGGVINKTVPRLTLKNMAQNLGLDPIFARHEPILAEKLEALNRHLAAVDKSTRAELLAKLAAKEKREGKRAITEADRRRWILPETAWQEWEVPFDADADWPEALRAALTEYRAAFQAKMKEVNACIELSSEGEELVDQPQIERGKLRVSGPFTVEAVQPAEESLDPESPIGGAPEEALETFDSVGEPSRSRHPAAPNAEAYLTQMIRLLRQDGVRFPNNQTMQFATLDALEGGILHAEGRWEGPERSVAVTFGPQHGPVTARQVSRCLRIAAQRGYDELVFAGFSFDGAAQATIQADPDPIVRSHLAHINPDVMMGDLLKDTSSPQLFTVFGLPRTTLEERSDGKYTITMEGVDIYEPVKDAVFSANADKVAAWFVDTDYDESTFCISQAFFPDKKAWERIARALKGVVDAERFEQFSGTVSLPFAAGQHQRVAVKVIDARGNEVMRVHDLGDGEYA